MIEPFDWNVVVAGSWNRAIFTPKWIQRKMFEREGALIEVQVPLDVPGPPRIVMDQVAVQPAANMLVVAPLACNLDTLEMAAIAAARAVASLPETPISACGVNIRYRVDDASRLTGFLRSEVDDSAVAAGFQVQARQLQRTFVADQEPLRFGVINTIIAEDENGECSVVLNFHRATVDPGAVQEWLRLPRNVLMESATTLLGFVGIKEAVL